ILLVNVQSSSLTSLLCVVFSPADQRIITAEPGENVILPCRADENKDVIFVEWSRTDLEADEYVLLYIFNQFFPEGQSPSFSNRVSLLDVKNGDVSLVLKNVTTHNTGRYECRVRQRGNNRRKRALVDPNSIINLIVGPDRINITAEPGDNVILLYRADKMEDVRILVWNRTGLESGQPVLLYRDWWFPPEFQLWSSPSFRNWGDLLDVKNGDVSLVLKDVTTEDTGIYVCQVFENGAYHRLIQKSISIINLRVKPGESVCGSEAPAASWLLMEERNRSDVR
uniref:Ig-like domain-containing protein n=1 Tax=Fundulus heteroclitus TaxID=8078 RepID=A0A3Q2TT69_FUNHE